MAAHILAQMMPSCGFKLRPTPFSRVSVIFQRNAHGNHNLAEWVKAPLCGDYDQRFVRLKLAVSVVLKPLWVRGPE